MGGVGKSSGVSTPLDRGSTRTTFDTPERQYIYDQGWDGLPTLASGAEFEKAVKESPYPLLYRGASAPSADVLEAYQDSLMRGEWFPNASGKQFYGYGMYTAVLPDNSKGKVEDKYSDAYYVSRSYATHNRVGGITRVVLKKGAKLGSLDAYFDDDDTNLTSLEWAKERGYAGLIAERRHGSNYVLIYDRSKLVINTDYERVG